MTGAEAFDPGPGDHRGVVGAEPERRGDEAHASRGGKVKTVLQSAAIIALLAPTWALPGFVHVMGVVLMVAAVVVTVVTGVDYLVQAARLRPKR